MRNAPIHSVIRYTFTARPDSGDTVAEGLTREAASALASALRQKDSAHAYGVRTMPLRRQAELLASGETMAALAQAA